MKATIPENAHTRGVLAEIYRLLFTAYGPQHWWPGETRDEIIIGAVLTQNTNWSNVTRAIDGLKALNALNLMRIQEMPEVCLAETIRPAGYYNLKSRRLRAVAQALSNQPIELFSTAVARTFLLSVYGIGPETADSILLYAYGRPVFVVDAYTRRIFSRLGRFSETADYEAIRSYFENNQPQDVSLFNEYHALIVRHAKEHCRTRPDCQDCPLKSCCQRFTAEASR